MDGGVMIRVALALVSVSMRARSSGTSTGLVTCSAKPASMQRSLTSSKAWPVTATAGICRNVSGAAKGRQELVAVHAGHREIDQQNVRHPRAKHLESHNRVLRAAHRAPGMLDREREQLDVVRVVIDDEHGGSG
jgi:hypothetical protein